MTSRIQTVLVPVEMAAQVAPYGRAAMAVRVKAFAQGVMVVQAALVKGSVREVMAAQVVLVRVFVQVGTAVRVVRVKEFVRELVPARVRIST